MLIEKREDRILYSTNKEILNRSLIHEYLSVDSYWAKHIPMDTVNQAIDHSLCFGAYIERNQVAFARVVTDYATFGYLADVFVLEHYRGQGISKGLMEFIMETTDNLNLRRFMLATLDAQDLYKKFGFKELKHPERIMEISRPDVYGDLQNKCS